MNTDKKINVLLTAIGCPGGPTLIQSLRRDPCIKIIGTDMREDISTKYLVEKFYNVPPGMSEPYIDTISKIVAREKIDVILPLATFELDALSRHKECFRKEGCEVCVSDIAGQEIANNKYLVSKRFEGKSFIPDFETATDWEDMQEKMAKLGFPDKKVVIKPFVSHGSIGLKIVDNNIDLYAQYRNNKPYSIVVNSLILEQIFRGKRFNNILLQEYLPGGEYGVDLLLDPVTHKVMESIVRDSGSVTLSSVDKTIMTEHSEILKVCKYIAEELKLSYSINMAVKLDENGKPKIMEVNPRLPATAFLAVSAGLNLPLLSVYLAMNRKIDVPKLKEGLILYVYRGFLIVDNRGKVINWDRDVRELK